jgi:hypothetical protein
MRTTMRKLKPVTSCEIFWRNFSSRWRSASIDWRKKSLCLHSGSAISWQANAPFPPTLTCAYGDLYLILDVVLPPADRERAKELYQVMARDLAFNPRQALGV